MKLLSKTSSFIILIFLVWLIGLNTVGYISSHTKTETINDPWKSYSFTYVPYFARWDSGWYASVARQGYVMRDGESDLAFFPIYPLLIRALHPIFSTNFFWPGQIISIVAAFGSLYIFYLLARFDYSEKQSRLSLLYLITFPTSFFLVSVYSESTFLLLLLLSFYFARKQKWLSVFVAAALLTATRVIGVFIIPALIFEYLAQRNFKLTEIKKDVWFLLFTPLPFLGFLLFSYLKFDDALAPFFAQHDFARRFTLIPVHVWSYLHDAIYFTQTIKQGHYYIFYDLAALIIFFGLLVWGWKRHLTRTSYIVFAFPALLLPVFSGTLTSLSRYVLILFPVFFIFSNFKNRYFKIVYFTISIILLIIAAGAFVRWKWIA